MPRRIAKACRFRGCKYTTTDRDGFCEHHKGAGWERHNKGQSAAQRGYGADWRKIRNAVVKRDKGLCQTCKREGIIRPGSSVDHIKPKARGGLDELDNLECICSPHHASKTARERLL